jgi:hypothetical protein
VDDDQTFDNVDEAIGRDRAVDLHGQRFTVNSSTMLSSFSRR